MALSCMDIGRHQVKRNQDKPDNHHQQAHRNAKNFFLAKCQNNVCLVPPQCRVNRNRIGIIYHINLHLYKPSGTVCMKLCHIP